MTRDLVVLGATVIAFATLVTVHVTLVFGLARHARGRRALVALLVPPLAVWWGWRERMTARGALWLLAAATYVVALGASFR